MNNPYHDTDMPIGLAYQLSMNIEAMNIFAEMTIEEKKDLISRAKKAKTKEEVKSIVDAISHIEII